jgi:hypothetical protein
MATDETPGSEPATAGINQGATGARPLGESPANVATKGGDAFDERPEAFVGAAFIGGFALAMILKRVLR